MVPNEKKNGGKHESESDLGLVPGKSWFAYFRLYEPTETYFDKSWPLGDFERIK